MKRTVFIFVLASCLFLSAGHAASVSELVAQLEANPSDSALREQIIKTIAAMKPVPAVSEDARRKFVQGNSASADAKTPEDMERAIALYKESLGLAPWWGEAYFNLAKVQEQKQDLVGAIQSLKFYLLASPSAPNARETQDKIYVLEEKAERAAHAAAESAAAAAAAQAASAQRKQWASSLHSQLSAMFAGKIVYKGWVCSLNRDVFTGCTDAEYKGTNWWNYNPTYPTMGVKFDLSPDGEKVLFSEGYDNGPQIGSGYFSAKVGTPAGPTIEQIQWVDDQGARKTIDFWVATSDGKTYYMISDSPGRPGDPAFDYNTRYQYWKHQAS